MRELDLTEVAAVSGGVPDRLQPDALFFEAPQVESSSDYFNELLALSRGLRAQLDFI
jgi:hypothetical protein